MNGFSEKVFLELSMPNDEDSVSDQKRIQSALRDRGFEHVTFPLHILRALYPMCRNADFRITVTLVYRETEWVVTAVEPGDQTHMHCGIAVDYGSTTIVMQLIDMRSGTVIDQVKAVNGQTVYGTDILTRITYSLEDPSHMDDLQKVTVDTFQDLLHQLSDRTGINATECGAMIVSGNTTMIHFLLRLNAWTVFASPFAPVTAEPGWVWGRELGLDFAGVLYIIPAASNYIGGDIVSGLVRLGIHRQEETSLFFDIGTNGELALWKDGTLYVTSTAAGPAFEGAGIQCGCASVLGAIDRVDIEGDETVFHTIGEKEAVGLCGSGLIDAIAALLELESIDETGAMDDDHPFTETVYLAPADVRAVQLSKAAIFAGIQCLMDAAGCREQDVSTVYLAGGFGSHMNLYSAARIGLLPESFISRVKIIGNAALDGAAELLLNREAALPTAAQHVSLGGNPKFNNLYMESMLFE